MTKRRLCFTPVAVHVPHAWPSMSHRHMHRFKEACSTTTQLSNHNPACRALPRQTHHCAASTMHIAPHPTHAGSVKASQLAAEEKALKAKRLEEMDVDEFLDGGFEDDDDDEGSGSGSGLSDLEQDEEGEELEGEGSEDGLDLDEELNGGWAGRL